MVGMLETLALETLRDELDAGRCRRESKSCDDAALVAIAFVDDDERGQLQLSRAAMGERVCHLLPRSTDADSGSVGWCW